MAGDLTDEELTAVIALVRDTVRNDPWPRSRRIQLLKRALTKLDPPAPVAAEVFSTTVEGAPPAERTRKHG